jgi:hypothetical protein
MTSGGWFRETATEANCIRKDRARAGRWSDELPSFDEIVAPQRADPASIRVEADGAQVARVEIARLDEAPSPYQRRIPQWTAPAEPCEHDDFGEFPCVMRCSL